MMMGSTGSTGMTGLTVLTATALCYAGMTALAAATDRHREQVRGRGLPVMCGWHGAARIAGAMQLALAWLACAWSCGASIGSAAWCGLLAVGAGLVALLLAYQPGLARPMAWLALAIGLAGLSLMVAT